MTRRNCSSVRPSVFFRTHPRAKVRKARAVSISPESFLGTGCRCVSATAGRSGALWLSDAVAVEPDLGSDDPADHHHHEGDAHHPPDSADFLDAPPGDESEKADRQGR